MNYAYLALALIALFNVWVMLALLWRATQRERQKRLEAQAVRDLMAYWHATHPDPRTFAPSTQAQVYYIEDFRHG